MTRRQKYINLFACAVFIALVCFLLKLRVEWYVLPLLVLAAGMLSAAALRLILRVWLAFSKTLGKINATVVLFLVYFFMIVPYALFFRKKFGKTYVKEKPAHAASLFKKRNHAVAKTDFEKSW